MKGAPLDYDSRGDPPSKGLSTCSYVATGENNCMLTHANASVNTSTSGRTDQHLETFQTQSDAAHASNAKAQLQALSKHHAMTLAANVLLRNLPMQITGSSNDAQQHFIRQFKAEQAFGDATAPSMTASVEGLPDRASPGLIWYRYDQGYFNDNPKFFQSLKPTVGGVTMGWKDLKHVEPSDITSNFLPINQYERFSFLIKGYFVPKTSGIHMFTLGSDDASYMWFGSAATVATANKSFRDASISLPGIHGVVTKSVSFNLSAGTAYPMAIMYGQGGGGYNLQFSYAPPGGQSTTDGTGVFYCIVTSDTVIASAVRAL